MIFSELFFKKLLLDIYRHFYKIKIVAINVYLKISIY